VPLSVAVWDSFCAQAARSPEQGPHARYVLLFTWAPVAKARPMAATKTEARMDFFCVRGGQRRKGRIEKKEGVELESVNDRLQVVVSWFLPN